VSDARLNTLQVGLDAVAASQLIQLSSLPFFCSRDGVPLVTIALILPRAVRTNANLLRWTVCTEELCFNHPATATFFGAGKAIPIQRGGSIYQRGVATLQKRINDGQWVHLYAEGRVWQEQGMPLRDEQGRWCSGSGRCGEPWVKVGPLKWGVGKLIANASKTPIVVPIYHRGLNDTMPQDRENQLIFAAPQLQNNTLISVQAGDPISVVDLIDDYHSKARARACKRNERRLHEYRAELTQKGVPKERIDHLLKPFEEAQKRWDEASRALAKRASTSLSSPTGDNTSAASTSDDGGAGWSGWFWGLLGYPPAVAPSSSTVTALRAGDIGTATSAALRSSRRPSAVGTPTIINPSLNPKNTVEEASDHTGSSARVAGLSRPVDPASLAAAAEEKAAAAAACATSASSSLGAVVSDLEAKAVQRAAELEAVARETAADLEARLVATTKEIETQAAELMERLRELRRGATGGGGSGASGTSSFSSSSAPSSPSSSPSSHPPLMGRLAAAAKEAVNEAETSLREVAEKTKESVRAWRSSVSVPAPAPTPTATATQSAQQQQQQQQHQQQVREKPEPVEAASTTHPSTSSTGPKRIASSASAVDADSLAHALPPFVLNGNGSGSTSSEEPVLEVIPTRTLRTGATVPQYVEAPLRIKPPDHLFLTPTEAVEEEDYRLQLYSDIAGRLEQALVVLEAQVMRRRREVHGHIESRPMEGINHRWGPSHVPITYPGVPRPVEAGDEYAAKVEDQIYQSRYQSAAFAQSLADEKNEKRDDYERRFKKGLDEDGKRKRGLVGGVIDWLLGDWEGGAGSRSEVERAALEALEATRAAKQQQRSPIATMIRETFGGGKKRTASSSSTATSAETTATAGGELK
jgi:Acyltransferase